jgi:hypothetical protein
VSETKQDALTVLESLRAAHANGYVVQLSPAHVAALISLVDQAAQQPEPRISAEAIAFMKDWRKKSDPVLREGMGLLIEAVEQWAQRHLQTPEPKLEVYACDSLTCQITGMHTQECRNCRAAMRAESA